MTRQVPVGYPEQTPMVPARLWVLRGLVVLQTSILPLLGIPGFFRNEAAWHYRLWQRTPFWSLFDGFMTSRSSMSNAVLSRPLVRALEWIQVRTFGLHSSWYIAFNGFLFVLFGLSYFELTLRVGGTAAAVVATLLMVGCYPIVFYPVLNAIHGMQYPLEMLLCTSSLLLFWDGFSGRPRRVVGGVVLWLLASVSHAASAIVVPLAVAAVALGSTEWPRTRRFLVGILSPLAIGLAFLLERQGVPGGLMAQAGWSGKLQFSLAQFGTLGALSLKPPGGPLLIWAFSHQGAKLLVPQRFRGRPLVFASLLFALGVFLVSRAAPALAFFLTLALMFFGIARLPRLWFLFVWALTGILLFIATPEHNASYTRHFIVPTLILSALGLVSLVRDFLDDPSPLRLPSAIRERCLELISATATFLLAGSIVAATWIPIPLLSARVGQVRYVGDLGLNFRRALEWVLPRLGPDDTLDFFEGRSRDQEMQSLYGADYFRRLQPAKAEHYDDFVAMLGRPDVQVRLVDPASGPLTLGGWLVAVNEWEIERAKGLCNCEPQQLLVRGRSRIALFKK